MMALMLLMMLAIPANSLVPESCTVFCSGPILEEIQRAGIFNDSKDFVDSPLRASPSDVLASFNSLPNLNISTLTTFYTSNFMGPGHELEPWVPSDWKPTPSLLARIHNPKLRDWAAGLNRLWQDLGRKIPDNIATQPERHSLLMTKHPFIIPGGRFREVYYWDTHWIVRGLLACDMFSTALGMAENLIDWLQTYGHVPNGGRVYYLNRSQPPVLPLIVSDLVDYVDAHSADVTLPPDFLSTVLPALDAEYDFFLQNRSVEVVVGDRRFTLSQYRTDHEQPRPESFVEDYELVNSLPLPQERKGRMYADLAAAAESGWDFSSRWFQDYRHLNSTFTSSIVPVCLNSILLKGEKTLEQLWRRQGSPTKADIYSVRVQQRSEAMNSALFDPSSDQWRDFDLSSGTLRSSVDYASNYLPLWADLKPPPPSSSIAVVSALESSGLIRSGGLLTSSIETSQQWDYPNAWAPLQQMLVEGVEMAGAPHLAVSLAVRWIASNHEYWEISGTMAEKYDALVPGQAGGGGEYVPQTGFGWTNGVILWFLERYGTDIRREEAAIGPEAVMYTGITGAVVFGLFLAWLGLSNNRGCRIVSSL